MPPANAIRAGRAFVEIFADSKPLMRGLHAVSARLKAFGVQIAAIGRRMMMMGAMIAAPLILAVRHFTKVGDQLDKMSKRTGLSVEALSGLAFAARRSGTNIEDVEMAIKRMQRTVYDFGRGLAETVDAFKALGLTLSDLAGLAPEDQFALIARRLAAVEDATTRAALAQILFGRAGTMILPMIQGYDALIAKARQLGLILTAKDIASAHAFADAWGDLLDVLKINVFMVGSALAPALIELAKAVVDCLKGLKDWVKENSGLVVRLAKVAAYTIAAGAALWLLGTAFKVLAVAITVATVALKIFGVMLHLVFWKITLIVGILAGLGYAILKVFGIWDRAFKGMGKIFSEAWGAIMSALSAGDMEAAFGVLTATLSLLWAKFTTSFKIGWIEAVADMRTMWEIFLHSIEGSLDPTIRALDKLNAKVGAAVKGAAVGFAKETGIMSQAEAMAARDRIRKELKAALDKADRMRPPTDAESEARLRQIHKERDAEIAALEAVVAAAEKALQSKIDAAKAAKAAGVPGAGGGAGAGPSPDVDGEMQRARSVGTFNPYAIAGMDPQGKILKNVDLTLKAALVEQKKQTRLLAEKARIAAVAG